METIKSGTTQGNSKYIQNFGGKILIEETIYQM
jgi:hypothetical protein